MGVANLIYSAGQGLRPFFTESCDTQSDKNRVSVS